MVSLQRVHQPVHLNMNDIRGILFPKSTVVMAKKSLQYVPLLGQFSRVILFYIFEIMPHAHSNPQLVYSEVIQGCLH